MGLTHNQLQLIKAVAENKLQDAKKIAICCCEEDKTQKNQRYIAKYKDMLTKTSMNMVELPYNISAFASMEDLENTYLENRYYLTEQEKTLYELIKQMNDVSLQLMEKKIPYLNATLLYGESGVGKTEFSRYVSYKLGLPYLYVNFSKMCDSYLGGTAKNLTALFNFINQQKCVVMLDEIDAIASKRKYSDNGAVAEISRSTTCLLQLLDATTNDHVILSATNLLESVDEAVLRRFTEKHEILRMSAEDNECFICQYLDDCNFDYDLDSIRRFAAETHCQAEIMTVMTRAIAEMLIHKKEKVYLEGGR